MQVLLSPSKKLDEKSSYLDVETTQPVLLNNAEELITIMQAKDEEQIASLMHLSSKLSILNYERYQAFNTPFTLQNASPSIFMFKGDVYDKMDIENYNEADLKFAQQHVRILSGLYGLLKPLDLIQAYRLEMGTKLATNKGKNLYNFWGDTITKQLNSENNNEVIINLASKEYFSAVQPKNLTNKLITINFKHLKDGKFKTIGIMAKRARGLMTDYIIKNRIINAEKLKSFSEDSYTYLPEPSTADNWVFAKDMDIK